MSGPHALVALALLALALPPPAGLLVGFVGGCIRRSLGAGLGLLALGSLAWAAGQDTPTPPPSRPGAWQLQAVWRSGLAGPRLQLPDGRSLPVRLAADRPAPQPGSPVLGLLRRSTGGRAEVVAWSACGPPEGAWLDRWQLAARRRVEQLVHPERQGLVRALLLGDRSGLLACDRRASLNTGTLHLLALSGLHVAILARGLWVFGRGGRGWWHGLLLVAFVALTGARAPLRRALLGWAALRGGAACGRHAPALCRLASVALILLALEPTWREDLGAWFSFLGVAGLLTLARPGPLGALAPSGAFLATAPLAAEHFGRIQPWGLLVTPLLVPAIAAQLMIGALCILPGALFASLDGVLAPLLEVSAGFLQSALAHTASLCSPPLQRTLPEGLGRPAGLAIVFALHRVRRWRR